jgi:hypothetical protein
VWKDKQGRNRYMTSAVGTMNNQDIMTYLRKHGAEIREMIDQQVKTKYNQNDGYKQAVQSFRSGNADEKSTAAEMLSNTITEHKKAAKNPRQPSRAAQVMDSPVVQKAIAPTHILQTGDDFKGMGQGLLKIGKSLVHQGKAIGYGIAGPVQFAANGLSAARKTLGISDLVWTTTSAAVIAVCIHQAFIDKVELTTGAYASTIETHDDDFCSNRDNLNGDALTAVFSRAHYNPDSDRYPHYLSALEGTKVNVPPVLLMMIQSMETGFYDVRGSRTIETNSGSRITIDADAQGLYQSQVVHFLEHLRDYGKDSPFYQDLQAKSILDELSSHEKVMFHSLDTVLDRVEGLNGDQIKEVAADLQDGRLTADEAFVLDMRNNPAFMGQIIGMGIAERYPMATLSNLQRYDVEEQYEIVKNIIEDIYQEHLMGGEGERLFDELATIPGLRVGDRSVVQGYMTSFSNPYNVSAQNFINMVDGNSWMKNGSIANTTFEHVNQAFEDYVSQKTELVTSPINQFFASYQAEGRLINTFNVCVTAVHTNDGQVIQKTRAGMAFDILRQRL